MNQLPGMPPIHDYHDFQEQLQRSEISLQKLDFFYRSCFPNVLLVIKNKNKVWQRQGIDTIVILENMKKILFDEKKRSKDWSDILLEEVSVWINYPYCSGVRIKKHEPVYCSMDKNLKPGWISGNKLTDYITYIFIPSKRVYFLPFLLLQRAWKKYYHIWIKDYGRKVAKNKRYVTTNIPIPTDILFRALFEEAKF